MQRGSKHKLTKKRTNKRMQRGSYKKQRGGMQRGGFFSFFNSNIKPKNLVDKKTPEDIFKMKQPISIEADFFEKYKDELDALAIPQNIREALQMMMDMKNKETVFNKFYKDKGTGSKVHSNPAIQAPAGAAQSAAQSAAPAPAQSAAPAAQSADEEDEEDEDEEEEEEEEQAPAAQAPAAPAQAAPAQAPAAPTPPVQKGGAKRTRRSQKARRSRKARKARKSRRTARTQRS